MTHDEMIEATKQALADTTNFDGDRLASHFSDSELDDMARAAIRVIAPAVLEEAAEVCENYMRDCLEDRDIQRNWAVTSGRNKVYAHQVRALKTRYEV